MKVTREFKKVANEELPDEEFSLLFDAAEQGSVDCFDHDEERWAVMLRLIEGGYLTKMKSQDDWMEAQISPKGRAVLLAAGIG